jgi:formylglycine-generating enzyme required for sulfatase activity
VTALEEKKPIVPVIFQECRVPSRLRLLQRIDLIANGLEDTINLNRLVVTLGGEPCAIPAPPIVPEVSSPPQQEASFRSSLQPEIIQPPQDPAPSTVFAPTFRNSLDMDFVLIPAGEFQMGSKDGEAWEKPVT